MLALAALLAMGLATARAFADPDAPGGEAEEAAGSGSVIVAVLPYGTTVEQIAAEPQMSPGIVSAGIGAVPVAQTFLDVSQGNRLNRSLYDGDLPRLYVRDGQVPERLWNRTLERAEDAPANIVPGLLASTLADSGVPVVAEADSGLATLMGVDRDGVVRIADPRACRNGCGTGLSVLRARLDELHGLVRRLGPDDLLVAFAAGARAEQELLPAGVAGEGFEQPGNLTSDSTRSDGIVLATDIAPTVLDHFGVEVPSDMNGTAIRAEGERDPAEVADQQAQLENRPGREEVVLMPLLAWLAVCALVALVGRGRAARPALRLLALACAWAPLILLVLAGVEANQPVSAVAVGLGAPALAALTDRLLPGYRGLALACAASVAAHGVDVVVGSPLTAHSVLGPNPGAGVRFFGIGNELEAILTTLTLIGTGAWLGTRPGLGPRSAVAWFVAVAVVVTAALAPGPFGADVGAAIVLGVGAATASVLALGMAPGRAALVVVGGGILALVALFAVDAVIGGAHLTRSVLGAGGANDVLDVLDRRVTLMTSTFIHPIYPELLIVTGALLLAGALRARTILAWFGDAWAARCGYLGALAGVLVGTLANDSGSVLLVTGTIYLAVCGGFFWGNRETGRAAGG